MKIALFPGSFDPFTKGHADVVSRGLNLFDKIIIAIGHNTAKNNRYFSIEDTVASIRKVYEDEPRIEIITYNELTASLAKKHSANFLLRGLRNTTDFEYENSISQVNRHLGGQQNSAIETVFLITSPSVAWISSSIVREVHKHKGDISTYLP
jgi:pantetheine-phosphate adenylyltransferase